MIKKYFSTAFILTLLAFSEVKAQVIFHEDFSGSTLVNGCAHLPPAYTTLKIDTLVNNNDPLDSPFDDPAYSSDGWAIKMINTDTCAVATAAVTTSGTVERWIITPVIYGVTAQSILMWRDASYSPFRYNPTNSYEVRITADTSLPVLPSQFTASSQNLLQYSFGNNNGFTSHAANLTAFAGLPVRIAFRQRDTNVPFVVWQLIIDDITIINSPNTINLASDGLFAETFSAAGDSLNIWERFTNEGSAITGYTWHVTIGNFYNDSFAFTNTLNTGGRDFRALRLRLPNIAPGEYVIKTWTSSVTSSSMQPDFYPANDTLTRRIRIIDIPVNRNVLVEETTGAWCGDCPQGGLALMSLAASRPWVIPVSVHTSDSMTTRSSNAIASHYNAGYPSIVLDRLSLFYDPDYWGEYDYNKWPLITDNRHPHAAPASVSIINQNYDWQTRQLTVTVAATFFNDATGPFRMNCFLTENNIVGPANDLSDNHWNNHSYFDTTSASAFFGMGPLLDPSEYQHQHVLDTTLSYGPWGDAGIIPDTVLAGSTFVHTYSITLPVQQGYALRWKPLDISAVAFVSAYDDFPHNQFIVNAASTPIVTDVASIPGNNNFISVYPNPAADEAVVKIILGNGGEVTTELFSIEGKLIFENDHGKLAAGENNLALDLSGLSEGIYLLKVTTADGVTSCKIVHRKN
jgi:hypothetical protein